MSDIVAAENPPRTGELIHTLFEATAHATGDEFFRVLVSQLATVLEVRFVFVAELLDGGKNAHTLAFWADGRFVDNMRYAVAGTVCETVIEGEIVQINKNLHTLYPADEELMGVRLESYLGIPLKGRSGEILGHVVAMDSNPMIEKTRDFSQLEIFAARATAEMERRKSEQALRYRIEIEKLVTSISTRFVNLTPEEMENAIDDAVALIGSFTGVDGAWLMLVSEDRESYSITHEWCSEEIEPIGEKFRCIPTRRFARLFEGVGKTNVIQLPSHYDPLDATISEWNEFAHFRSLILVPLLVSGETLGFLGLGIGREGKFLADDDLRLLSLVGEVFACTLRRKQSEEELQRTYGRLIQSEKMAALGQLTAGITHELNTPIGVIRSHADLVGRSLTALQTTIEKDVQGGNGKAEKVFPILQESASANREAISRISSIVSNLQTFIRLDEAAYQDADLHQGIDSALGLLIPLLKSGVKVVRKFGEIPTIRSHHSELNQVFMTLLRNANDAIEAEGTIIITTFSDQKNIYAKITDSGRGIPQDMLDSLFDVGFSTRGSRVGMRLGLTNAFNIIKNHDGHINVKSEVGKGTEFTIQLPIS